VVNGPNLKKLEEISRKLVDRVKAIPGVVDLDTSLNVGKPELSVQVDRPKAADLGVQIGDAAEALRLLVGGDQVTTYNEGGEQYEVHLRARAENRSTQAAIGALTVPSSKVGSVALDNVASFAQGTATTEISRSARRRQVTVLQPVAVGVARRSGRDAGGVREAHAGGDYRGALAGRRRARRAGQNFVLAFLMSLVFMYLILAAQFGRGSTPSRSPVAAADAALCAAVYHRLRTVAHILCAGAARAARRGEEEPDSADRPCEPAHGERIVHARRDRAVPRPACPF
jgi:HAE1 family hydrophobic/amphiphilic exporter-1